MTEPIRAILAVRTTRPATIEAFISRSSGPEAMMNLMAGSLVEGLSLKPEDLLQDTSA